MAEYSLRNVRPNEAEAMSGWRYDPPFDWYEPGSAASHLDFDEEAFEGYLALVDQSDVAIGFVCLGAEARVAGQTPADDVVDIGLGIDPSLISRGLASDAMAVVLDFLRDRNLRTAIWAENDRAISLAKKAGFVVGREFDGAGGRPFLELTRGGS